MIDSRSDSRTRRIALLSCMLLLYTATPIFSQTWARSYSFPYNRPSQAKAAQQTHDLGFVIAGNTYDSNTGKSDIFILKLDTNGDVQWLKTYGGDLNDNASSIIQTSGGGYVIAGQTERMEEFQIDIWISKLDSLGTAEWQKSYGTDTAMEGADSICQTTDGGFAVAATTFFPDTSSSDIRILKLDPTGTIEWQYAYGGPGIDYGPSVLQTGDGGYVVGGTTKSQDRAYDFWVLRLDPSGSTTWQKSYGREFNETLSSVQRTSDLGFVLAGDDGRDKAIAVKLDSSGNLVWQRTFSTLLFWELPVRSVQQTSDSGYLLGGYSVPNGLPPYQIDAWIMKLDSTGSLTWRKRYGPRSVMVSATASAIVPTADGGILMAGDSESYSDYDDVWVLKLDSEGNINDGFCPFVNEASTLVEDGSMTIIDTTMSPTPTTIISIDTSFPSAEVEPLVRDSCCSPSLPPSEVSGLGSAQPLLFTSRTGLIWEDHAANGACFFNLYRGDIADLRNGEYGDCLLSNILAHRSGDFDVPSDGTCWFYLVTGVAGGGEGPMGFDSTGAPRTNSSPCP